MTGHCRRCYTLATAYDAFAGDYDYARGEEAAAETIALVRLLLPDQPDGTLVDLGCGTGKVSRVLVERGWYVIGVDASAPMLTVASGRIADTRNESATATSLARG